MKRKAKEFSIIDKEMSIEGMVIGKGSLVINGTVNGSLKGDTITISEDGRVFSETKAAFLTIGGLFDGKADISGTLVLLSTGKCSGEICCGDLVVEAGATLNAKVTCGSTVKRKTS